MIGQRIKEFRLLNGAKVAEFAGIIGISQGSLSNIENGKTKPSAETIASLVRNTNIDPTWLLTGEKSEPVANRANTEERRVIEYGRRVTDQPFSRSMRRAVEGMLSLEAEDEDEFDIIKGKILEAEKKAREN